MNKFFAFALIVLFSTLACKTSNSKMSSNSPAPKAQFGESFTAKNIMKYDDLLAKLEKSGKLDNVVVEGQVAGVCQMKGCWMNIVSEQNANAPEMFVKFKDYAFFMPLDLTGKVIMKGNAYKEVTSVEELKHYAEDEGKSPEEIAKITKPVEELKFMASGVQILN